LLLLLPLASPLLLLQLLSPWLAIAVAAAVAAVSAAAQDGFADEGPLQLMPAPAEEDEGPLQLMPASLEEQPVPAPPGQEVPLFMFHATVSIFMSVCFECLSSGSYYITDSTSNPNNL